MAGQAVVAMGVDDEFRLFSQAPQGVKHHLAFAEEDRLVLDAVHDQHRRADLVQVEEGGLGQVAPHSFERAGPHAGLSPLDVVRIPVAPSLLMILVYRAFLYLESILIRI